MLIQNVLAQAQPLLQGRTITNAVLGLSLIGIELDDRSVGLAYMLRENLPSGCSVFGFAQNLIGHSAIDIARLAAEGTDDAQRGVGMATLNAAICSQTLPDEDPNHQYFGIDITAADTVGMIGYIPPVAERIAKTAKKLIAFDEGIMRQGGRDGIYATAQQAELLPTCDVVVMTGTVMINHSVDVLLSYCTQAREVVMVGSSTPMLPEAFRGSGVTVLAGSCWSTVDKDVLFKRLSLSCGMRHLEPWMIKKAVPVR